MRMHFRLIPTISSIVKNLSRMLFRFSKTKLERVSPFEFLIRLSTTTDVQIRLTQFSNRSILSRSSRISLVVSRSSFFENLATLETNCKFSNNERQFGALLSYFDVLYLLSLRHITYIVLLTTQQN